MVANYLELNQDDSRAELIKLNPTSENTNTNTNKDISKSSIQPIVNENKFMNMKLHQIFDNIVNILPNMYNDYNRLYLQTKLNLKNTYDNDITESDVYRETMRIFLFENENIVYLGILILIIAIFLYIIN